MMVEVIEMMEEDISQLIFLRFTSYFSLCLDFSPSFFLLSSFILFLFQKYFKISKEFT